MGKSQKSLHGVPSQPAARSAAVTAPIDQLIRRHDRAGERHNDSGRRPGTEHPDPSPRLRLVPPPTPNATPEPVLNGLLGVRIVEPGGRIHLRTLITDLAPSYDIAARANTIVLDARSDPAGRAQVDNRGRVVLPLALRSLAGIRPRDTLAVLLDDHLIVLTPTRR